MEKEDENEENLDGEYKDYINNLEIEEDLTDFLDCLDIDK
jgi:hypothetical protein